MDTLRKYWSFLLVGIIATAIPVSALFLEPDTGAASPPSDRPQKPGVLQRTDNLDYTWVLHQANGPSRLRFRKPGPPITIKTDVRRGRQGTVLIGLVLEGRGGETYRATFTRNGARMAPPELRIIDKHGNVIERGRFGYG